MNLIDSGLKNSLCRTLSNHGAWNTSGDGVGGGEGSDFKARMSFLPNHWVLHMVLQGTILWDYIPVHSSDF